MTSDLSLSMHISKITAKAHYRANCILRCFECTNISLLVRAFLVYVRPIIEYCFVVWLPCLKQDIETSRKVQRRFTKRLKGLKCMSYKERLRCLDLRSLELRHLHLDLLFCYKIVFGLVYIDFSNFFQFACTTKTRGHVYKMFKSQCTSSVSLLKADFLLKELSIYGTRYHKQ